LIPQFVIKLSSNRSGMKNKNLLTIMLAILAVSTINSQVHVRVTSIPHNTPTESDIYIAGDFQNWNPGHPSYRLEYNEISGDHHIDLAISNQNIQFKFTRGDWSKVESDANGNFIPNRSHFVNDGDTLSLSIAGWEDLDGGGSGQSTAADNVSILTDSFYISAFDRYRRVWVYLPPDYDSTTKSYPVLYMHDGQNVFESLTSFAGEWEVDETLNALHEQGDPGIIVVAVDNGQFFRTEEYTPWANPQYGGGRGSEYVEFLIEELKPYIDQHFRTLPSRKYTGIMGSSLGGLISTYAGIEYQEIFGKIGAFSPAYWFNPESLIHVSEKGKVEDMRIYQIAGTLEGSQYIDDMFEMHDTILANGFEEDEIMTIEKTDGQHSEWFWAREFKDAYLWLYKDVNSVKDQSISVENELTVFPNPTTDSVSIKFELTQASHVSLRLYNLSGQIVVNKDLGKINKGLHEEGLSTKSLNLSKGKYLCRVAINQNIFQEAWLFIK